MNSSCPISYVGMVSPQVKKRLFNIGVASSPTLTEEEIVNEIEEKLRVLHE